MRAPALALTLLSLACGARTGLDVPDVAVDAATPMDISVPLDAGVTPPICIEVPRGVDSVVAEIATPVTFRAVDVMFVIDATASMDDEIAAVRRRLRDVVVPGVRDIVSDARFGVAFTGEFPFFPHGVSGNEPYQLRAPITDDTLRVEGALAESPSWGNLDVPEAQVEGLYQVATGEGLGTLIAPSIGCPGGGFGGACFRRDAISIAMLITDAPFNNGPPGVEPISTYAFSPAPHSYAETLRELQRAGIFVIGLGASDFDTNSPMPHLRAVARDTGTVGADGAPLAFDIGDGGGRIGSAVVDAVAQLAEGVPLDVVGEVRDVPGDAFDARTFVRELRPLALDPPGSGVVGPEGFEGVRPGAILTFELVVDAAAIPDGDETLLIPARVQARSDGRSLVGSVDVLIVVLGDEGGCDDL